MIWQVAYDSAGHTRRVQLLENHFHTWELGSTKSIYEEHDIRASTRCVVRRYWERVETAEQHEKTTTCTGEQTFNSRSGTASNTSLSSVLICP